MELVAETVLLGWLLWLILWFSDRDTARALGASPLPVFLVLALNGYYLTRSLLGLLWKGWLAWLYSMLAAALFLLHMGAFSALFRLPANPYDTGKGTPFLLAGALIVCGCSFAGRWLLVKWAR